MGSGDLLTPAASFWHDHGDEVTAAASLLLAFVAAGLVDRAFARRGRTLAVAVARGELTPVADTRLRFLRRVVYAAILLLGAVVAAAQFTRVDRLAASLLASGVVAAAVVGFAARQTLANLVAGVMLAVTQPLRIGDAVSFEGESGVVEDVRLNYTFLRTGDGTRVIIPNERLATGMLRNATIIDPVVAVEASVWLDRDADIDAAVAVLLAEPDVSVRVAEATSDGVRLAVQAEAVTPGARGARESELLAASLRRLRDLHARSQG
jgi:small-conductance mechanosensitive channel